MKIKDKLIFFLDLAQNLIKKNRYKEAKKILLKSLEFYHSFHACQLLSMVYEQEGNLIESLKYINKAIELNPSEKSLYDMKDNILIKILEKNIGKEKFLFYLKFVLSNNPDLVKQDGFYIFIFNLLNELNNISEIKKYTNIIKESIFKKMDKEYILNLKGEDLVNLMRFYFILADYKTSFEIIDYILNNSSMPIFISISDFACPWGDDRTHGRDYLNFHIKEIKRAKIKGRLFKYKLFYLNLLFRYAKLEVKKDFFINLSKKYPDVPIFKYQLVVNYLNDGNLSDAYKYMYEIANSFKNDWYSLCKLGEIMICLNKNKEGISCFKKAEFRFKKSLDNIFTWEGQMCLFLGKYRKAISILNKAINLNSNMGYCWRAAAYYKLGYIEEAIIDLRKAISLSSNDYEAMLWYSEIMIYKGDREEAMKYLNKILYAIPKYDFAYLNRALLYYKTGDFENAIKDLNKVDKKIKEIIYLNLKIDIAKISHSEIGKIIPKILDLFKGNRRWERYFISIISRRSDLNR